MFGGMLILDHPLLVLLFMLQMSDANGELKNHTSEQTPLNVDTDSEDAKDDDLLYGWGSFKPNCLQFLNNAKCFVFALALFAFIQGN